MEYENLNSDNSQTGIPTSVWSPDSHCPALDGVRGIAILSVTLYRLCKDIDQGGSVVLGLIRRLAPIGERGVDLFFVLSGFLITSILLEAKGKPNYFRNFLARRSLRIFPLYFLTIFLGLWVIPAFIETRVFDLPRNQQLYLWTYTSNLRMSWLNQWCFGPFDHFWTLAVEEHFYFVWPAIVFLVSKNRLVWFCAFAVAIVFVLRTIAAQNAEMNLAVDVLTIFRADALCLGGTVAGLLHVFRDRTRLRYLAGTIAILTFPLLIGIAIGGTRLLGIPNTVCPTFLATSLLWLLLSKPSAVEVKIIAWSPLRFLGKYSYGMYVFQLPMVVLFPLAHFQSLSTLPDFLSFTLYVFCMSLLITGTAFASFHLFEKPFLGLKRYFR